MRYRRTGLVVATAVVAVLAVVGACLAYASWPSRGDRDTTRTYRVWHWNIAGSALHHGSVSDGLIEATSDSIRGRGADFASLNEICYGQYRALRQSLAGEGWPQDTGDFSRFARTRTASPELCGGTGPYGIALFSRQPLGVSQQFELPSDGSAEQRKMLCAALRTAPRMKFCTVHVTTRSTVRDGMPANYRQIRFVRRTLDAFDAKGEAYLVAGDFNAQPDYGRLKQLYAPSVATAANHGNTGANRELDDADRAHCPGYGQWTAVGSQAVASPCGDGPKVDEIFVRESRLAGAYSAASLPIPRTCSGIAYCSDHRALFGTVRMTVPSGAGRPLTTTRRREGARTSPRTPRALPPMS
ncbi:endonuclease/exonuclease/phosphatase family protein [Streptomyces sp. NRRL S-813]|uniref:endonuclease/exonuclease/phosphatase family protein n=1 Tax=Streptomyces sp. NRRL S-813 TaxID=1463919 RepID=UPI00131E30C2|nr:endonuclease/exonuclease/phosphatase family protein [Streptomyces sp. NRRL S-813]